MTALLDTHYLLWAALKPEKLPIWAANLLKNLENTFFISSASIYEISQKSGEGSYRKRKCLRLT